MSFSTNIIGTAVWTEVLYPPPVVAGVSVLVVASSLSLIAALVTLFAIFVTSFQTEHAFIRSHLGAYFISLLIAELIQSTGSLLSVKWISLHKVQLGQLCAIQGALKNAGNVSTALWTLILAIHTFTLIFLKVRVSSTVCYVTICTVWAVVGFIAVLGPAVIQRADLGPFWGVSGYWCWITPAYQLEQLTMEYLFMFVAAATSLVLYTLIFFRLRGNIELEGFYPRFSLARAPKFMSEPQIERVGKRMLLYPVCYVLLVLPIAICRWSESFGTTVPFGMTVFADAVFLLSGLVNAVLYCTTRRVAPIGAIAKIPSLLSEMSRKAREEKASARRGHLFHSWKRNTEDKGDESFIVGEGTITIMGPGAAFEARLQRTGMHTIEEESEVGSIDLEKALNRGSIVSSPHRHSFDPGSTMWTLVDGLPHAPGSCTMRDMTILPRAFIAPARNTRTTEDVHVGSTNTTPTTERIPVPPNDRLSMRRFDLETPPNQPYSGDKREASMTSDPFGDNKRSEIHKEGKASQMSCAHQSNSEDYTRYQLGDENSFKDHSS